MRDNKENFFSKMKNSEHSKFEITMFSGSVFIGVVLLISVIWVAMTWVKANSNNVTDEEANASSVTESAITKDETEVATATPYGNAIINDNNVSEDNEEDIDPDLTKKEYGYTSASVNMRSSASLTATVIAKVPMNTRVKLVKLHDKEWMEVIYDGTTGYINAMYLTTTKTAVATYAPTTAPSSTTAPTSKPTKKPVKTSKPTKKPVKTKKPATATPKVTSEPVYTSAPTMRPTQEPEKPTEEPKATEEPKVTTDPKAEQ